MSDGSFRKYDESLPRNDKCYEVLESNSEKYEEYSDKHIRNYKLSSDSGVNEYDFSSMRKVTRFDLPPPEEEVCTERGIFKIEGPSVSTTAWCMRGDIDNVLVNSMGNYLKYYVSPCVK